MAGDTVMHLAVGYAPDIEGGRRGRLLEQN